MERKFYLEDIPLEDAWAAFRAALDDAGPVSYTHLRAHETVLDLVCRLLLEKKKKQISTQIIRSYN